MAIYIDPDTGETYEVPDVSDGGTGTVTPTPPGAGGAGGDGGSPTPPPDSNADLLHNLQGGINDAYQKLFGRDAQPGELADAQRMIQLHGSDAGSYLNSYVSNVLEPRTNNSPGSGQQGTAVAFGGYNPTTRQGSPNGTAAFDPIPYSAQMQPYLQSVDKLYVQQLGRHLTSQDVAALNLNPNNMPTNDALLAGIKSSAEYKGVMARGGPTATTPPPTTTTGGGTPPPTTSNNGGGQALFDDSGQATSAGQSFFDNGGFLPYQPFTEQFTAPSMTNQDGSAYDPNQTFQAPTMKDAAGNAYDPSKAFSAPTEEQMKTGDPGYQARMDAAQQALERSAAARGTLLTGGTQKALGQAAQDYASNEYNNFYGQSANTYGMNQQAYASNYGQAAGKYGMDQNAYQQNYNNALQQYMTKFNVNQANQGNAINTNRNNILDSFGMASTNRQLSDSELMNAFGIYNSLNNTAFNQQYGLASLGLQGASGLSGLGSQISDLLTQRGNAAAAGLVGSANAWNQGLGNAGNAGLNAYYASLYNKSTYGNQGGRQ